MSLVLGPADLLQALGLRQLAEQHRDRMVPRIEHFGIPLGSMLDDELAKLPPVGRAHHITQKARPPYHLNAYWCGVSDCLVNIPTQEPFFWI